jgi:Tfp pilus tip-associated adhesin PilY1
MIRLCKSSVTALALILCAVAAPSVVRAQSTCDTTGGATGTDLCPAGDTDIFMGNSSGNADAPNIIILLDNSTNWSRQSQAWGVNPDGSKQSQGQAELAALQKALLGKINGKRPANVGLAMLTDYGGSATASQGASPSTNGGGAYIRFGVRDMTNAQNNAALQTILGGISGDINGSTEKVTGQKTKDESAAFYEIYKYLSGLTPFTGLYNSTGAQSIYVDVPQNHQILSGGGQLLSSGFALVGGKYQSPINPSNPCAATYIIYIANNASQFGQIGQPTYEPTVAIANPMLTPPTGSVDTWLDEWTYFLKNTGVAVPTGNNNGSVVTFVLDAFNPTPDSPQYSLSLSSAAVQGGGGYFAVRSATDILNALSIIFSQIQAVNSTFASASLPVNTTNRTQDRNQVFIPMFRPDPKDNPRWMGNLKQFQLILDPGGSGAIDLGDNSNPPINAVNNQTGFLDPCALSFWTTDSNRYWANDPTDLPVPQSLCGQPPRVFSTWSDYQDGPIVEKGGIGEVIRKGNNPPTTNTTPTWTYGRSVYTLAGLTGTSLVPFTSTTLGTTSTQVAMANFILGHDVGNIQFTGTTHANTTVDGIAPGVTAGLSMGLKVSSADGSVPVGTLITAIGPTSITLSAAATSSTSGLSFTTGRAAEYVNNSNNLPALPTDHVRPSVHGDEIHSRPQPVDYGVNCPGQTDAKGNPVPGSIVFYGSNDGTLRAIDTCYGKELWAFIAPEFYASQTGFSRLMNNSPGVSYFGQITSGMTVFPTPKDFYFDGSVGLYQNADNSQVWIYPSMRRGGRTIYAFDVTVPGTPKFKWKAGCPFQESPVGSDTGCADGQGSNGTAMRGMGQTWSTPVVATSVLGHTGPVIIVGGGYDTCEDANTAAPLCGSVTTNPSTLPTTCGTSASPKGAGVYVLDAFSGALLNCFPTTRSVAADVALIAVATAGVVDHAYAVDTGGNIYRLDFAASQSNWRMNLVAYTNGAAFANGAGRKFLFAPALLAAPATLPAAPGGQVYLALGSGDREHPLQSEYPYTGTINSSGAVTAAAVVNRFYVFKDDLPQPGQPPTSVTAVDLDDTTATDTNYMYDYTYGPTGVGSTTSCSTPGVLPNSSVRGWFINLNQYGNDEQTVSSAIIAAGMVAFSTNRPIPAAQGSCSTSLGEARGYWLNLFNASGGIAANGMSCGGSRSSVFIGGGLPPSPVLANVVVGGQSMTVTLGTSQLSGVSGVGNSSIAPQQVKPTIVPTRKKVFWKSSGEN